VTTAATVAAIEPLPDPPPENGTVTLPRSLLIIVLVKYRRVEKAT
jgi:hypothetical protein